MNLQEAAAWIKDNLIQEIGANTLGKACASGRLRGASKGEGSMPIRRTEWEVTKEGLKSFIQEEYHPRLSRRIKRTEMIHIPNEDHTRDEANSQETATARPGTG